MIHIYVHVISLQDAIKLLLKATVAMVTDTKEMKNKMAHLSSFKVIAESNCSLSKV